jgi:hypothetical protein
MLSRKLLQTVSNNGQLSRQEQYNVLTSVKRLEESTTMLLPISHKENMSRNYADLYHRKNFVLTDVKL